MSIIVLCVVFPVSVVSTTYEDGNEIAIAIATHAEFETIIVNTETVVSIIDKIQGDSNVTDITDEVKVEY